MTLSYTRVTASGSTDTFSVPFGYLDKSHVTVKLNGVALDPNTDFTWPTDGSVQLSAGNPSAGTIVEIRRVTPATQQTLFTPGNLPASDLNAGDLQSLYLAQEGDDKADDIMARFWYTSGGLESGGTITKGTANQVATFDASGNLVPGEDIASEIDAAAASAAAAAASETAAAASATAAATSETNAGASATAAATSETNAGTSEANAADSAGRFIVSDTEPAARADSSPLQSGDFWINATSHAVKVYDGASFFDLVSAAASLTWFYDVGDGATNTYALDGGADATNTLIIVGMGALGQEEGYTLSAGSLVFDEDIGDGVAVVAVTWETTPVGVASAAAVTVLDAGGWFSSSTVEGVLQEIGALLHEAPTESIVTPQQFGALGEGGDETTELQAMFDSLSGGELVYLGGKTYNYSTLTIDASCTILNGHLASATASGTQITVDPDARVVFRQVELSGGGSKSSYVANHNILKQYGTAHDTGRAAGIVLDGCRVHGAGMHGILTKWSDDIHLLGTTIYDCAYAGAIILSPQRFRARDCYFLMLGAVGTSGNAYGLALSYESSAYNLDPNAGKPTAVNHFPIDCVVDGCTFYGPDIWEALDHHGGYQISFINNKIYAAKFGIMFGNGSGDAANYAGYQNFCCNNVIDVRGPDGATHGVTPANGITLQGGAAGTTGLSWQLIVTGNIIRGYGSSTPSTNSVPIHANVYVDLAVISGNVICSWTGYGIVFSTGAGRVICNDNVFDRMSASSGGDSACIRCDSSFTGHLMAVGNLLDRGGNQPVYGLRNAGGGYISFGSDFRTAGTAYSDASGNGRSITWA